MTHVPRDTHVTKQRMAMRSNFPCSDLKKLGTPELSSSSSTSTALSLKNFEKRAHPTTIPLHTDPGTRYTYILQYHYILIQVPGTHTFYNTITYWSRYTYILQYHYILIQEPGTHTFYNTITYWSRYQVHIHSTIPLHTDPGTRYTYILQYHYILIQVHKHSTIPLHTDPGTHTFYNTITYWSRYTYILQYHYILIQVHRYIHTFYKTITYWSRYQVHIHSTIPLHTDPGTRYTYILQYHYILIQGPWLQQVIVCPPFFYTWVCMRD